MENSGNGILTEKESQVIVMRFGIGGIEPMALEQVGAVMGVTRERIRQIESKALRKLRSSPRTQHLRTYLEA